MRRAAPERDVASARALRPTATTALATAAVLSYICNCTRRSRAYVASNNLLFLGGARPKFRGKEIQRLFLEGTKNKQQWRGLHTLVLVGVVMGKVPMA